MGGGASKSEAQKREAEFRLSSDEDTDNEDVDSLNLWLNRSLYKLAKGRVVSQYKTNAQVPPLPNIKSGYVASLLGWLSYVQALVGRFFPGLDVAWNRPPTLAWGEMVKIVAPTSSPFPPNPSSLPHPTLNPNSCRSGTGAGGVMTTTTRRCRSTASRRATASRCTASSRRSSSRRRRRPSRLCLITPTCVDGTTRFNFFVGGEILGRLFGVWCVVFSVKRFWGLGFRG